MIQIFKRINDSWQKMSRRWKLTNDKIVEDKWLDNVFATAT